MNDELIKYYELLGVAPGASMQELKASHRDLAKVWHPDRFAHDPRLQQKAQEKLKEINEAYDQLVSGKLGRRTSSSSAANQPSTPSQESARRTPRRTPWKFALLSALAFVILFFVASYALIPSSEQRAPGSTSPGEHTQAQASEGAEHADSAGRLPAVESSRGKRADQQPAREARSGSEPTFDEEKREVRPLPTVTVTIDPVSGMLATPNCPVKSRMTYPSGAEPRQHCNIAHKSAAPEQEAEQTRAKESRLKSFAKRLAAPAKVFGGKGKSDEDNR